MNPRGSDPAGSFSGRHRLSHHSARNPAGGEKRPTTKRSTPFSWATGRPKVEFVGPQSVIERDSRQLLHVRAQNVNNLKFEGVRVPPLLLPMALAVEKSPAGFDSIYDETQGRIRRTQTFRRLP